MEQVDLVNPETDLSPDEGLTVGSMTTESSGASIRAACAEARALFVAAAARRLGCGADALDIEDGAFLRRRRAERSRLLGAGVRGRPGGRRRPARRRRSRRSGTGSSAGAPTGSTCRPRCSARPTCTTSPGPACCTRACCASRGSDAKLAGLDEAAIRHAAAGAPVEILREAKFVAFLSESEAAANAALGAAEQTARWDGARDLAPALSETASLKELPCAELPVARSARRSRRTAAASRPATAAPTSRTARWGRRAGWRCSTAAS